MALPLARIDFRRRWPSAGAATTGNERETSLALNAVDTFALIGGSLGKPSEVSKAAPKTTFTLFDWSKVHEGELWPSTAVRHRAKVAGGTTSPAK